MNNVFWAYRDLPLLNIMPDQSKISKKIPYGIMRALHDTMK
jgi:hypothetical protein